MNNYKPKKAVWQADISKLTEKQRLCLDYMVKLFTFFNCVFVSQQAIADYIGVSRKTINEYIKLFCEMGLIQKFRRFCKSFKKSNVYKFSSIFTRFKDALSFYLPSLKGLKKTPLYADQTQKVTLSIKGSNNTIQTEQNINKNSSILPSSPGFLNQGVLYVLPAVDIASSYCEKYYFQQQVGCDLTSSHAKLTEDQWDEIFDPAPKFTVMELSDWYKEEMKTLKRLKEELYESDIIAAACSEVSTVELMGPDCYYSF